jgi:RNA polymerase sigma-70 factor (ECF subfamily)
MLQVRADAEDAVQEAWIRLSRAKGVDSVEGFLATTVTRLCIDQLKSARVQRERYVGPWLPEPLPTAARDPGDPGNIEERVERAEMLSIALLQVIDRLNPVERAVFLLREAFSYPYEPRVVRNPDKLRGLASRES